MIKNKLLVRFGNDEQVCCVCKKPLPAHETWPGARHPFCGSRECSNSLKERKPFTTPGLASQVGLYIGANERKCDAPDCNNFIPEGRYDDRNSFQTCSGKCWFERDRKSHVFQCGCGCGEEFLGTREKRNKGNLRFMSAQHHGAYLKRQALESCPDELRPVVEEFLDGFAASHYGNYFTFSKIRPFFEYLKLVGISSLEAVTPPTVTNYLKWTRETGRRSAPGAIHYVSTFFKWAIASGYREHANPVITLIHNPPKPHRLPRPLAPEQLSFAWDLLIKRGTARTRLVAAIAEESGARLGEICRLRVQDYDSAQQRLFIRLPNKGNEERYSFFSEKTKRYYEEWMRERDLMCGHDRLLHGERGHPCTIKSLSRELSQVLCKEYGGKKYNEDGFDKCSTHRLRHCMASALVKAGANASTVMAAGGWKSYEAMCGYAEVDADLARQGYDEAMKTSREQKTAQPRKKAISVAEFRELRKRNA